MPVVGFTNAGSPQAIVDQENIQRSRLRVDARKWAAARLAPRKYRDRVEHDHKGGGGALGAVQRPC
jgi:hypothetical protein